MGWKEGLEKTILSNKAVAPKVFSTGTHFFKMTYYQDSLSFARPKEKKVSAHRVKPLFYPCYGGGELLSGVFVKIHLHQIRTTLVAMHFSLHDLQHMPSLVCLLVSKCRRVA